MNEQQLSPVTQEDVESLAEKLDALAASMPEGERAALARIILNAAQAQHHGDTSGYLTPGFSSALSSNIALGSNFTNAGQTTPNFAIAAGQLMSKDRAFFRTSLGRR